MILQEKVAIVTGGGRNIGRAVSLAFAREGAEVFIFDMDEGRAAEVTKEVQGQGGKAAYNIGAVERVGDVQAMVRAAVETFGKVDILVNCAAISDRKPMLELPDDEWQRILDVTLTGTYLCCKYVAQQMVQQGRGGAIVNFSSGSALQGNTGRVAYDVAKAGIMTLSMDMAVQLARYGIRTNTVAPCITGSQVGGLIPPEQRQARNLVGRVGHPEELASVVLFLVSDASSHIWGQTLLVDGGERVSGGRV
jgi:3-oxoacyl-[acyl-carrier protein] reductase